MTRRLVLGAVLIFKSLCLEARTRFQGESHLQLRKIAKYFRESHCPAAEYAASFVRYARLHSLDYRLLPAIAMIESTGGKHAPNRTNWFGWNNGRHQFRSVEDAIANVAQQLANDQCYRGKNTREKLAVYNRHPEYPGRVLAVMQRIDSVNA